MGLSSSEFSIFEFLWGLEDWFNNQVEIVDVSSVSSLKDGEVSAERSMGLEWVTAWATEFEFSALVGGETDVVEDVTISSEEGGQEFIRTEFNAGFLDTWVKVGGTEVLVTLDNGVWSVDEVVGLETEDILVIMEDSEVGDLMDTTIWLKLVFVAEEFGVTVSLSSEEFVSGWGERLESSDPWEWVNIEVEVVDVSTETSSKTIEVLAVWGLEGE